MGKVAKSFDREADDRTLCAELMLTDALAPRTFASPIERLAMLALKERSRGLGYCEDCPFREKCCAAHDVGGFVRSGKV